MGNRTQKDCREEVSWYTETWKCEQGMEEEVGSEESSRNRADMPKSFVVWKEDREDVKKPCADAQVSGSATDLSTEFSNEHWILGREVMGSGLGQIKVEAHPYGGEFICSTNTYGMVILCLAFY